jgi:hypothetical protein
MKQCDCIRVAPFFLRISFLAITIVCWSGVLHIVILEFESFFRFQSNTNLYLSILMYCIKIGIFCFMVGFGPVALIKTLWKVTLYENKIVIHKYLGLIKREYLLSEMGSKGLIPRRNGGPKIVLTFHDGYEFVINGTMVLNMRPAWKFFGGSLADLRR